MGLPERLAVQRRLSHESAAIGERLMAAVEGQVPAYASISDAQLTETRAIASWAVRRLLEMWVDDSSFDDADRRRFHGIGVARATDGRPLLAVLRAYRVAAVETTDLVIGSSRDTLELDDVIALNRTLLTSIEELSESLFSGYTTTTERMSNDRDQSLAGLTRDLLTGRHTSATALADRTRQLGVTVPPTMTVVVLQPRAGTQPVSEGDAAELAALVTQQQADGPVLHTRLDDQVVVLCTDLPDLTEELCFRDWVACRTAGVDATSLPRAHQLAASAARHAPADAFARGPVLDRADALLVGLLRGEPSVDPQHLARAALGALLSPAHTHLLEGLAAYLTHGSSTGAAEALTVHPQTMRHRLRRVHEVSGRDVRSSWDRLMLHHALAVVATRQGRS